MSSAVETQKSVSLMSDKELRIKVAELCGLHSCWIHPNRGTLYADKDHGDKRTTHHVVPDYCHDLNAMHEAEKVMTDDQFDIYTCRIYSAAINATHGVKDIDRAYFSSAARQRAEAFVLTMAAASNSVAAANEKV